MFCLQYFNEVTVNPTYGTFLCSCCNLFLYHVSSLRMAWLLGASRSTFHYWLISTLLLTFNVIVPTRGHVVHVFDKVLCHLYKY